MNECNCVECQSKKHGVMITACNAIITITPANIIEAMADKMQCSLDAVAEYIADSLDSSLEAKGLDDVHVETQIQDGDLVTKYFTPRDISDRLGREIMRMTNEDIDFILDASLCSA